MRLRYGALLFFAVLAACSDSTQPVAPPTQGRTESPPPPTPPIVISGFGPLTRSGRIYAAAPTLNELYTKYHGVSLASRYVLYDDSTFALQFVSGRFGVFEYDGRYTRADARITFTWEGWSIAGPWGSEATLSGDSLSVRYNLIMQMTDFVDGTYVRLAPP